MRVMIIITLVIANVNLSNISCVNISYRRAILFLLRTGTTSPPIKTASAAVSLSLSFFGGGAVSDFWDYF